MPRVPTSIATNANNISRLTTKAPAYPIDYHGSTDALTTSELALQATVAARSQGIDPGNVIKDVVFTAGANKVVEHRLQRAYEGFLVRRPRGTHPVSITEIAQNSDVLDKVQITLNSNTACTADIEVY